MLENKNQFFLVKMKIQLLKNSEFENKYDELVKKNNNYTFLKI